MLRKTNGVSGQCRRAASSRFKVPTGVDLEIVERPVLGEIVRRLSGAVDDQVGMRPLHEAGDALARSRTSSVVMVEAASCSFRSRSRFQRGVAVGTEEVAAHVVVDADDRPAEPVEVGNRLGADQAAAAGDQNACRRRSTEKTPMVRARAAPGP